jgi:hypothetical protein
MGLSVVFLFSLAHETLTQLPAPKAAGNQEET